MRYFTPELYRRYNSSNDATANRADEEWEAAIESYGEYLNSIRERLPKRVAWLAEMNLHDAELLDVGRRGELPTLMSVAVLPLRSDDRITILLYRQTQEPSVVVSPTSWPFSKEPLHWLYDEIALVCDAPLTFQHSILVSDGRVLQIQFNDLVVREYDLEPAPIRSAG